MTSSRVLMLKYRNFSNFSFYKKIQQRLLMLNFFMSSKFIFVREKFISVLKYIKNEEKEIHIKCIVIIKFPRGYNFSICFRFSKSLNHLKSIRHKKDHPISLLQ